MVPVQSWSLSPATPMAEWVGGTARSLRILSCAVIKREEHGANYWCQFCLWQPMHWPVSFIPFLFLP